MMLSRTGTIGLATTAGERVCLFACFRRSLLNSLVCSLFEGSVGAYTLWTPRQNLAGSRGQDEPEQQWHGLRAAKASGVKNALIPVKQSLSFHKLSLWIESLIRATDDGQTMHFVNLYDRQLPGENRNELEHGLWQSSWYVIA